MLSTLNATSAGIKTPQGPTIASRRPTATAQASSPSKRSREFSSSLSRLSKRLRISEKSAPSPPPIHKPANNFIVCLANEHDLYNFFKRNQPEHKDELEGLKKLGYHILSFKLKDKLKDDEPLRVEAFKFRRGNEEVILQLAPKDKCPYTTKKAEISDCFETDTDKNTTLFNDYCKLSHCGFVKVCNKKTSDLDTLNQDKSLYQGWLTQPPKDEDLVKLSKGSIKDETSKAIDHLCEIIKADTSPFSQPIAEEFTKLKAPLASDQVFPFGEIKDSKLSLYPNLKDLAFSDALATQTDSFCSAFSDSNNIDEIEKELSVALYVLANPKLADQFLSLNIDLEDDRAPFSFTKKYPQKKNLFDEAIKLDNNKTCSHTCSDTCSHNMAESILKTLKDYQDDKPTPPSKNANEEEKTKYIEDCKTLLKQKIDKAIEEHRKNSKHTIKSNQEIYRALFYTTIVLKKVWAAFNLCCDECSKNKDAKKPVKPTHNPFIYSEKDVNTPTSSYHSLPITTSPAFDNNQETIINNLQIILGNINAHDLEIHSINGKDKEKKLAELNEQINKRIVKIGSANQSDIMKYAQCLREIETRLFHLDRFRATKIFSSEIDDLNKLSKQLLDKITELRKQNLESIKPNMLDHIDTLAMKTVLRLRKATIITKKDINNYNCFLKDSEDNLKGHKHFLKNENPENKESEDQNGEITCEGCTEEETDAISTVTPSYASIKTVKERMKEALQYYHPHNPEPVSDHPLNRPLYHFITGQAIPVTFTTGHSGAGKSTAKDGLKTDKTTLLSSNEVGPRDDDYKNNQFSITTQNKKQDFIDFLKKQNIKTDKINIDASTKDKDLYVKGCFCCSDQDKLINILEKIEFGLIDTDHILIDVSGLTGKETAVVLADYPWASIYLENIIGIADSNQPIWKNLIQEFRKDKAFFLAKTDETKEGCFKPDELLALEQLEYATLLIDNDKGSPKQYSADFMAMINCYRESKVQEPLDIQPINLKQDQKILEELAKTAISKESKVRTRLPLSQVETHHGEPEKTKTGVEIFEFEIKVGQEFAFIKALCDYLKQNPLRRFKGNIAGTLIQSEEDGTIYVGKGDKQKVFKPQDSGAIINTIMFPTQNNKKREVSSLSVYSKQTQRLRKRGG